MQQRDFTYSEIGATRGALPADAHHLTRRRMLGHGRALFDRVGDDILAFAIQRRLGIFRQAATPTAAPGTDVTVRLGIGPVAITAPCRVVYVLDEPDRRGFAYGTLTGHPVAGEELFAAEYDPETDTVHGVITAFSRAATWYTALGGPAVPLIQRLMADRYLSVLSPDAS